VDGHQEQRQEAGPARGAAPRPDSLPYEGKDEAVVGRPDPNIVVAAADVLESDREALERSELAAAR
jgi:hypothetical protein